MMTQTMDAIPATIMVPFYSKALRETKDVPVKKENVVRREIVEKKEKKETKVARGKRVTRVTRVNPVARAIVERWV
jgi:hypothetical protein